MRYRLCAVDFDGVLRVTESDLGATASQVMDTLVSRKVVCTGDVLYVEDVYYEKTAAGPWAQVPLEDPRLVGLYRKIVDFERAMAPERPRREW